MTDSTQWTAAIAILAAGLAAGAILVVILRRRKVGESVPGALEEKRDALLQRMRKTDDTGERRKLEREVADVLRVIDQEALAVHRAPFAKAHPMVTGFLFGVAATIGLGLLGYYGSTFARPREGSDAAAAATTAPAQTSNLQRLEQAVQNDPEDVDHRIALAKAYFTQDNLMGVFDQTAAVLKKNPDEPRALTYNAVVRMSMGQLDEARGMLEKATLRDPRLLDAWVALASVRTKSNQPDAAAAAIDAAIAQYPQEEKRLREILAEMRGTAAPAAKAQPAKSLPPDHPPMPQADPIRLTLSVEPGAAASGVLYVIARDSAQSGGHPVAVKRVKADAFPLAVELSEADSMMGAPFPPRVELEIRLDSDGDAGTRDPSDPKAVVSGVTPGTAIAVTLK